MKRNFSYRAKVITLWTLLLLIGWQFPVSAYAQATTTDATTTSYKAEEIAALYQIIQLLETEIALLTQVQNAQIQEQQSTASVQPESAPVSQPVVSDVAPAQAPQFVENPTWSFNSTRDGVIGNWQTDIPATATLYVAGQPSEDISTYQIQQQWSDASTTFNFTSPLLGTPFYIVVVSANGTSTVYNGYDN